MMICSTQWRARVLAATALALNCVGCTQPAPEAPEPATAEGRGPGPRWGHALVRDYARNEVLLFGGAKGGGAYLADTWTWNGEEWRQRKVPGPPARGFPAAAFHAGRGTVVLHGGRAEGRRPHSDTWEWNGAAWGLIEEASPFTSDHHAMVYLPSSDQLLAFGGWTGDGVTGETWTFDASGAGWRLATGAGPPGRSAFGMAYDAGRDIAVVTGGLWIEGQYADVWEWAEGAWRAAGGPYDNSSLDHHSLVWDPEREQILGFGGKNYRYRPLGKTFEVLGGRMIELTRDGPEPRHSTPLAWEGRTRRILLFGGKKYEGSEQVALGDLWAWDGMRWELLSD